MTDTSDTALDDITADLLHLAKNEGDILARAASNAITALRVNNADLKAALDSGDRQSGLSDNGSMWRFWSDKANALAQENVKVTAERDAAIEDAIYNAQYVDLVSKYHRIADVAYARGVENAAQVALNLDPGGRRHKNGCARTPRRDEVARAIRALADAPPAPAVGVMSLVWHDIDDAGPIPCLYAETPFGNYYIDHVGGGGFRADFINEQTVYSGQDVTVVKVAVQADYEARIRAVLLPQVEGGEQ